VNSPYEALIARARSALEDTAALRKGYDTARGKCTASAGAAKAAGALDLDAGHTLDRQAADAFAAGDYWAAAQLARQARAEADAVVAAHASAAEALAALWAAVERAEEARLDAGAAQLADAERAFARHDFDAVENYARAGQQEIEQRIARLREADAAVAKFRAACDTAEADMSVGDFRESLDRAAAQLKARDLDAALAASRDGLAGVQRALLERAPRLSLTLPTGLEAGVWNRVELALANEGAAHAVDIVIRLEGVQTKGRFALVRLAAGESATLEGALMSTEAGSVPVEISIAALSAHRHNKPDCREHTFTQSEWLEVARGGGGEAAGLKLPSRARPSPARAAPRDAPQWRPPDGLSGDEAVLGEYFTKHWECYRAAPANEAQLDYLHNNRDRFAISSYFELPASPAEVLQKWALPPNLRGHIHLDPVRRDIVERVLASPPDRNYVIIGEPGVGKTALLFELFDQLAARAPTGVVTTSTLGDTHLRFSLRLCYDDIPENPALVQAIAQRRSRGLIVTAREADWQDLPGAFQSLFDRLTVPLFANDEMARLARMMLTFSGMGYDDAAVAALVTYAEGSPIYAWSVIRELVHSGMRTLTRTYIRENAQKGMANYVAMILQRLLRDGKAYRSGGLHALASLICLGEHIDERRCHESYFRAIADGLAEHTEARFDDGMQLMTFNRVMAYLSGEGSQVRFPHDTWGDVLRGAGSLNPFRAEIQTITQSLGDAGRFEAAKRSAVGDAWDSVAARYRRNPAREKGSFLLLGDTLLRHFTLSELRELEVDVDLIREVASSYSHLPLAAMLVSKLQAAEPTRITKIINIQDSIISRSMLNLGDGDDDDSDCETGVSDSLVSRSGK